MRGAVATTSGSTTLQVPSFFSESIRSRSHAVQFYRDDSFLLQQLGHFVTPALASGGSVLLVATKAHREGLFAHLRRCGTDFALAVAKDRFVFLDADETLEKFMVRGQPDPVRFARVIETRLSRLSLVAEGPDPHVSVFGEMVACLWASGKTEAALRLERLWTQLAEKIPFRLLCGYPMRFFTSEQDQESLLKICAEHSHIIPAERPFRGDQQQLHSVLLMQAKTHALENEVSKRTKIQRSLEAHDAEVSDFLENAAIGMHWLAWDGIILWANKAELAFSGYSYDEYVGHHISEFYVDPSVVEDMLQRLGRREDMRGYEARFRCKDGSIRHIRIDSDVLVRNGLFIHARCFISDVTGTREAENAMFKLAAIVASSDDAIISKDLNGIITSWNSSAERILGYKAEEVIGKSITILIPPELQQEEVTILSKIRAGERIEHFQTTRLSKQGERLSVSLTVSPVRDRQGNIIGAAKILRDITQQRQMEFALHTSERLASVGRLAATIAHELNNPLEAITNFIFLAKQQPELSDETRWYLTTTDEELARVAHIVQQTLGFYRDNSRLSSRPIDEVIGDVTAIYDRKCRYKSLSVERRIGPGLNLYTMQGELKQVLSNLITNAIDASRDGGRLIIRARSSRDPVSGDSGIRITIADTGAGIPAHDRARLFVPFFTTKKEVGTGLGLWITKDLIEKRGGSIHFRSRTTAPSGTVMSIFLPHVSPAVTATVAA